MKHIVLVSGGKDSTATLFKVLEKFDKKDIDVVFCDTGWEHSLTYTYLKELEDFVGIKFIYLKNNKYDFLDIIEKYYPNDRFRTCNSTFKVEPLRKYIRQFKPEEIVLYTGVRLDESVSRSKRYKDMKEWEKYESKMYSIKTQKVYEVYPILTWNENEVKDYVNSKFKLNPLYDLGFDRVGCFPCVVCNEKELDLINKDDLGKQRIKQIQNALKDKDKGILEQQAKNYLKFFKY